MNHQFSVEHHTQGKSFCLHIGLFDYICHSRKFPMSISSAVSGKTKNSLHCDEMPLRNCSEGAFTFTRVPVTGYSYE